MNMQTRFFLMICLYLCAHPNALGAPLDLSNVPLFAATNAPPPNIMFVFDDSGSMDWNTVTNERNGLIHIDNCRLAYTHPTPTEDQYRDPGDDDGNLRDYDSYYPVPPEEARTGVGFWRARSHHYNRLYYNPSVSYLPWAGADANGDIYTDADPGAARVNPFNPGAGTLDLTRDTTYHSQEGFGCQNPGFAAQTTYNPARYWLWTDTDNDGAVDISDEHTRVDVTASLPDKTGPEVAGRVDCIADGEAGDITANDGYPTCTGAQELQNFANWFQYYRRREFTAKYAYKSVVRDAGAVNMGLVTLHNNNDVKQALASMSFDSNKNSLLNSLSRINAIGGTPLRSATYNTGKYLSCDSNSHFNACPAAQSDAGGACQQNFMIAMTDGFYNGDFSGLGNRDGDNNSEFDGGPYADDHSNTLADIAMRFYENDIHPALANILPIIPGIDEASHQHVNTYTVAFGVDGTLSGLPDMDTDGTGFWPDPQEDSSTANAEKIDDLRHAAFNGRGLFLSADSPDELNKALSDALLSIGDRASSAASVALNSSSLNSESRIYQARFDSGDWSGQLLSFPVSDGSGGGCAGEAVGEICGLAWDSGEVLKNQHWDAGRRIVTFNRDNAGTGVPFRWDQLSGAQKTDLRTHPDSITRSTGQLDSNAGKRLLEYIRGRSFPNAPDRRLRSSPLGDIVNSDPFFVAAPAFSYDFGGYQGFRSTWSSRDGIVYVGANDGMLHAFDEDSGQELFAYIPGDRYIWDHLSMLASTTYNGKHRYFVDGSPTVGDAQINGSWKTVLVGGLRGGGQTLYALDITDPADMNSESSAAANVLWEFSDEDDADLGYTFSQPNIVKMNNGRWAAVVGNGYNNTDADGFASSSGKASLFIIFLDGPDNSGHWAQGSDYIKLEVTGAAGTPGPNGLATPAAVDIDNDFMVDYIYAGDLGGNLWRFDVTDSTPGNWQVGLAGEPLFVAVNDDGQRQPITVRPEVGPHPQGVSSGVLVYFGTGRYLGTSDNSTSEMQSFYGILDSFSDASVSGRGELVRQRIIDEVGGNGGCSQDDPCFRVVSDNEVNLDGSHKGWYLGLVNTEGGNTDNRGERAVSNPILRAGRIIFTTLIPSSTVCEFGGDGWLMELDMFTGGRPTGPAIDTDGDGDIDRDDVVESAQVDDKVPPAGIQYGNGVLARPTILSAPGPGNGRGLDKKFASTSGGNIDTYTETGRDDGRLSWRELR